jgi:MFS transporter, Spinster family, sphingosine-1-phosphate transporter
MLSDLYPERQRGRILAWFYLAIPVGSALGFVIGGAVADTAWGWRGAFQVVVLPGLFLGAVCLFMRERRPVVPQETPAPSVPAAEPAGTEAALRADYADPAPSRAGWGAILRELSGIRSFVLCCAGMTCSTFVLGGVAAWAPYYIFEREARFQVTPEALDKVQELTTTAGTSVVPPDVVDKLRGLAGPEVLTTAELKAKLEASPLTADERAQYQSHVFDTVTAPGSISLGKIGTIFGGIVVVSGLIATLFGGWLGDRLRDRVRGSYFLVCGWGALVAFPAFVAMLYVPFPYAWGCLFVTVFFLFINTGPANTILANVTRHRIRASAFAVNILIIHLLGDAISPPLIGLIADLSSLGTALLCVSVFIVAAGVLWNLGARYLDAETRRVSAAETPA